MSDTSPPTTREYDFAALVRKALGKDASQVEDAYVFSNGRKFKNTDQYEGGPYGGDES